MTALTGTKRVSILAVCLALALLPLAAASPAPTSAATGTFAVPAFEQVWNYSDKPVQAGIAARSWTWGPQPLFSTYESYNEGPGGQHLVQYFDKSRMEINDPSAPQNSYWYVTNGLLVVEMVSGHVQVGDNMFLPLNPSYAVVAGDPVPANQAPSYAALKNVASLNGENRAPSRVGQPVNMGLTQSGTTATLENLAGYATYAVYQPATGHNIPNVFWAFMNQTGTTYQNGTYTQGNVVVPWLYGMGYPITEAYWINITVSGQQRWVLMQAFQRRILTYSPQNPQGWQVEMGNVGLSYYNWRYGSVAPTATPTPVPVYQPAISISPTSGTHNTTVSVSGWAFPPYAAVQIGVAQPSASYYQGLLTVSAASNGTFQTLVTLPSNVAGFDEVSIVATANNGALKATVPFKMTYAPVITVSPTHVVQTSALHVAGQDFPPNKGIKIGATANNQTWWIGSTKTGSAGDFAVDASVAGLQAGWSYRVFALADNGTKASYPDLVTVYAQPHLQVVPSSGPANAYVTLNGTSWPAGRQVNIGMKAAGQSTTSWLPSVVAVAGNGTFSTQVYVSSGYAGYPNLGLIAVEPVSGISVVSYYYITTPAPPTPTPVPRTPTVAANPGALAIGQVATVTGSNWQAGAYVEVGVGRPGYGVEEWLVSALVDGNRNIAATFTLGSRWRDVGQLVVTATVPGNKAATTTITVVPSNGRVTPGGLPMTVSSFAPPGGATTYKAASQGWEPGAVVHFSVVSADGTVNTEVAMSAARNDGTVNISFNATGAWAGRADLGLRAAIMGGGQYSMRYLPVTTMGKVAGTSGTYRITGFNWPASSTISLIIHHPEGAKSGEEVLRTIAVDAYGYFDVTVDVPRVPSDSKNQIELRGNNVPYIAWFDLQTR